MNINNPTTVPVSNEDVLNLISSLEGSIERCIEAGDMESATKFQRMLDIVKVPATPAAK